MIKDNGHRMSEQELAEWGAERSEDQKAQEAAASKARKISQAAKNELALKAGRAGDLKGLKEALSMGASPNARERARPRRSLLEACLNGGSDEVALTVLEAGGRAAPPEWGSKIGDILSDAFDEAALTGKFDNRDLAAHIKKASFKLLVDYSREWSAVKRARDVLEPLMAGDDLAKMCAQAERWDLAYKGLRDGASLEKAWEARGAMIEARSHVGDTRQMQDRAPFLQVFREKKAVEQMDALTCERLFTAATRWSDGQLIKAMLDAGLRPNPEWTVKRVGEDGRDARVSILIAAALEEESEAFDVLKGCKPAARAARQRKEPGKALRRITARRLLELKALGVAIDGWSAQEGNLLHAWADIDAEPRAGWASVAKELPELLSQKDGNGETPAEKMRKKLRTNGLRQAFDASLARIESSELKSQVPKVKAPGGSKAGVEKKPRL